MLAPCFRGALLRGTGKHGFPGERLEHPPSPSYGATSGSSTPRWSVVLALVTDSAGDYDCDWVLFAEPAVRSK